MNIFVLTNTFSEFFLLLIIIFFTFALKIITSAILFTMEENRIDNLIKKIAATRVKKGFSFENMAFELSLTPAAYRKIEIGKTKLAVERLFQISEILNTPLSELLEIGNDLFQQTNNENSTGYLQKIENFYHDNKEISQTLVDSLKDEIAYLKSEIEFLHNLVKN